MAFLSKEKIKLLLYILSGLIFVVIGYLLEQVKDTSYLYLETKISYKCLWILLTLTLLVLIYTIVYHLKFSTKQFSKRELKRIKEETQKEQLRTMSNLSTNERKYLFLFLKQDRKDLLDDSDVGEANSLTLSGVLECLPGTTFGERQFIIHDWAWEYMQSHKKDFIFNK